MFLSTAGSTWTHWSKGTERRKSKSHMCIWFKLLAFCCDLSSWHSRLLDLSAFVNGIFLGGFHAGRAWICFSRHGRKFRSWTKRRARIFSESSKKKSSGVFQQLTSGQLKYHSLHVTGSPGTSRCTRGQWSSRPSWPARTIRVAGTICQGNMDQWTAA